MANIPSYMLIRQYVMELFFTHLDYTRPLMSEHALAEKFGVSRSTIRLALDDLVRDGYLERRNRSGMYLSRNYVVPTPGRYRKILIVTGDGKYTFLSQVFLHILSRVYDWFSTREFRLVQVSLSAACPPAEELVFQSAAGVLWIIPHRDLTPEIEACRKLFPVQGLFGYDPALDCSVRADYVAGALKAVRRFQAENVTRPYLLGASDFPNRTPFMEAWMQAFPGCADRMLSIPECRRELLAERFRREPPEGLFCFGSEYPELAAAVAKTGIRGPVITDYPAMAAVYADAVPATGILDLAPEEEIRRACEALAGLVEHPETPGTRRCFTPSLRWKDGTVD